MIGHRVRELVFAAAWSAFAISCGAEPAREPPRPFSEAELLTIIEELEADRALQVDCATTQIHLGARIHQSGDAGWEFAERNMADREHARWLRSLLERSGG